MLLPFSDSLTNIYIYNCKVGSIRELYKFPKLKKFSIDSLCSIEDTSINPKEANQFYHNNLLCEFIEKKEPIKLQLLSSIARYIKKLCLSSCRAKQLKCPNFFTNLEDLKLEHSEVYLDAFLPIAKQIKFIELKDSTIQNTNVFSQFKQLNHIKVFLWDKEEGLCSLKKILPLKDQLEILDIREKNLKDLAYIKDFTKLKSLDISCISEKDAKNILFLDTLQKLRLNLETEKAATLDLSNLYKLEVLELSGDNAQFKGFERLQKLTTLKILGTLIEVNKLPTLPKLTTFVYDADTAEVFGLEQFPNLEKLKINTAKTIKIGNLQQLKILDLENVFIDEFNCSSELPNLEKLGLTCFYHLDKLELKGMHNLPKLKWLSCAESPLKKLDELKDLKQLEYLDLYAC